MVYTCAIGLGSNLGNSQGILTDALTRLNQVPGITVKVRSHLYCTAPVGPPQPDYLNGCALLETTLLPTALMHCLLQTEAQFGRVRQERWGPRLLDLDLLLFEDWQVDSAELTVPHPRLHERAFVLVPLQEIAPDWRHPNLGKTVAELATTVDHRGVQLLLPAQPEIRPQPVIAADLPLHSPHSDLSPGM